MPETVQPDSDQKPDPTPPPTDPRPPAPPPAAQTVVTGDVTEETLKLRQERDELAGKLKDRETQYSELERTHQEYRKTVESGTPIPVKQKPAKRRGPLGVSVEED